MTVYECKLSFLLLEEYFGPVVASICEPLKWGPKPLKLLSTSVGLPVSSVKQALSILINFNFVTYKSSGVGSICEYSLLSDNILQLSRYSKFILIARKQFGKEAEFVVRELLYSGKMTLYNLILKVTYSLSQEHSDVPFSLTAIKNVVCDLIDKNFLVPTERVTNDIIPVPIKLTEIEKIPNIDMMKLSNLFKGTDSDLPKNELFWRVNIERFLIEYRNEILVCAVSRRFGNACGVVMQHLLKKSFTKTDLWRDVSTSIPMMVLRDSIGSDSSSTIPLQHLKQYLEDMEEDSCSFIGRSTDFSGGTLVCFKDAFYNLAVECLNQVLNQKFGSPKAGRVFNIVRDKKYIELEQIPRIAMLADKEAKHITYKLLEENFIQMQALSKPSAGLGGASGPNKSFILFYVDCNSVIKMIMGMAFKNLYNLMVRIKEERRKNSHVFDKKKEADAVTNALREQKASEAQISEMVNNILTPPEMALLESVQKVLKRLYLAAQQVDETIFLLQVYAYYHKSTVPETKLKKKK